MSSDRKHVYLLGYPLGHSVSPAMQNAAFRALGVDWEYAKLEHANVHDSIAQLRESDCAGANVTVPHKQTIMKFLDEISETAQRIDAVNTIIHRDGKLIGDNTDAVSFITSLKENHIHPRNASVAILGAGGAACAAAFALAEDGAREIVIINRTGLRAAELADRLHKNFPNLEIAVNWHAAVGDVNILVNATSVGMHPNVGDSPMPHGQGFSSRTVVADLVYNPIETKFLKDAKRANARTIGGLGMLVHQGAAAFNLWLGIDAPIEVMRAAALSEMKRRQVDK